MNEINQKCLHHKHIKDKITKDIAKQNGGTCYNLRNTECFHTNEQRFISGFWTTIEINKALEKGYQIIDIYEVWNFTNQSTELWKGYIRKFLKIKLEISSYDCSEDEYRNKARTLGIELEELKVNSGLRFISKTCLNSLWGKFGQNPKVKQNEYIDNEQQFKNTVLNENNENLSLTFLNDSIVYASYDIKDQYLKVSYNTNIFIACYTTGWARLRLYDMLEKLDRSVCYLDTDSIIYIENEKIKIFIKII